MSLKYEPLKREDVKKTINSNSESRPPAFMHKWAGAGLAEYHGQDALRELFAPYPDDIVGTGVVQPGVWEAPEDFPSDYKWACGEPPKTKGEKRGHDSGSQVISDWSQLEDFLDTLPIPEDDRVFEPVRNAVKNSGSRYVVCMAWNYFFEKLWGLRGMENVLMDFHLHPKEMHMLGEGLLQVALKFVEGAAEAGADAFSSSNDLGHQTGLMMHPDTFREFLKPLLAELIKASHERGMDFWLHSCGNLTDILEDFAEIGLDALHPIQYGAMDWDKSAKVIDGRFTVWGGIDVQHILQEAEPQGVRAHVRELIDTFYQPGKGRLVVAAGNGITGSTPLENIDAFLDETFRYGLKKAES